MHLVLQSERPKNSVRSETQPLHSPCSPLQSLSSSGRAFLIDVTPGIDKDAGVEEVSPFDLEIRRRIWLVLYIWDW
jgi:hypothetical protein